MTPNDDLGGVELLRPLRDTLTDDGPPAHFDVATAIRRGDTIRHRRIAIGVFAAVAAIGVATGVTLGVGSDHSLPAPATSVKPKPTSVRPTPELSPTVDPTLPSPGTLPIASCQTTTLNAPPGAGAFTTWANGHLDPTGRYLAVTLVKPFLVPLADYIPGKPMLVDLQTNRMMLLPVAEGNADGVTSSGEVIGDSNNGATGWVYRNGHVSPLPKFKGSPVVPTAINERGDIVGTAEVGGNSVFAIITANQPGIVVELLPIGVFVDTISDTGAIGGSLNNQPYVGDGKGNGQTLDTEASDPQGVVYQIRGNYALGDGSAISNQGLYPKVWNLATGEPTLYPMVNLAAIATNGTVAGDVDTGVGDATRFALIGHDGVLQRLATGVSSNRQIHVYDISGNGHIVYGARHVAPGPDGTAPISTVGVVWRC
jgi:hypothetical protein